MWDRTQFDLIPELTSASLRIRFASMLVSVHVMSSSPRVHFVANFATHLGRTHFHLTCSLSFRGHFAITSNPLRCRVRLLSGVSYVALTFALALVTRRLHFAVLAFDNTGLTFDVIAKVTSDLWVRGYSRRARSFDIQPCNVV